MGASYFFEGVREPDEEWLRMKRVYDVCIESGVDIPHEVDKFFDFEEPDSIGIVKELDCEYSTIDDGEMYEIAIAELPENITHIRFKITI